MSEIRKLLKPYYHKLQRFSKGYRRFGLKNRDFTILSNNCTAGYVYQYFGLTYNTPTAGLFLITDDYIKLIQNPRKYFENCKLVFIEPESSKNYSLLKNTEGYGIYPIAQLLDIEIYFMHYHSQAEAENTFVRRASRINYNNLFFLLTENDYLSNELLNEFCLIPYKYKLCLISNDFKIKNQYVIQNRQVKIDGGNKAWLPKIILDSLPWKKVLNEIIINHKS